MTREEAICNAARERADRHEIAEKELHNYNSQLYFYDRIYNAEIASFEAGVEWADNHPINVWHDASEVPNENTSIVFIWYGNLIHKLEIIPNVDNSFYSWLTANRYIKQWAYIDDILPKGGEE